MCARMCPRAGQPSARATSAVPRPGARGSRVVAPLGDRWLGAAVEQLDGVVEVAAMRKRRAAPR